MKQINPLELAIKEAGSQAALASMIGVTQQTISFWLSKKKRVPAEKAAAIEGAVNGMVTRKQLRPDIFNGTNQ